MKLVPVIVIFTNTTRGDYTASLWDFGDGITTTQQHPTHTYTITGTYTVSLTVSGLHGRDTLTRAGYISVTEPISAAHALLSDKHPVRLP